MRMNGHEMVEVSEFIVSNSFLFCHANVLRNRLCYRASIASQPYFSHQIYRLVFSPLQHSTIYHINYSFRSQTVNARFRWQQDVCDCIQERIRACMHLHIVLVIPNSNHLVYLHQNLCFAMHSSMLMLQLRNLCITKPILTVCTPCGSQAQHHAVFQCDEQLP